MTFANEPSRIALREFKESRLRLRILRATGYLTEREDSLIQESGELTKIIATMIRNFRCERSATPIRVLAFGPWGLDLGI